MYCRHDHHSHHRTSSNLTPVLHVCKAALIDKIHGQRRCMHGCKALNSCAAQLCLSMFTISSRLAGGSPATHFAKRRWPFLPSLLTLTGSCFGSDRSHHVVSISCSTVAGGKILIRCQQAEIRRETRAAKKIIHQRQRRSALQTLSSLATVKAG